jgi:hypothetical protein
MRREVRKNDGLRIQAKTQMRNELGLPILRRQRCLRKAQPGFQVWFRD